MVFQKLNRVKQTTKDKAELLNPQLNKKWKHY